MSSKAPRVFLALLLVLALSARSADPVTPVSSSTSSPATSKQQQQTDTDVETTRRKKIFPSDVEDIDLSQVLDWVVKFAPVSPDVSFECRRDSRLYVEGVKNMQPWALKMLDAGSKLQSGLLHGNIKNLGHYDECLEVRAPPELEVRSQFTGQYCLASVQLSAEQGGPRRGLVEKLIDTATLGRRSREITNNRTGLPVPDNLPSLALVQWAVCVPSSCSPRDVQITLDRALGGLAKHAGLRASSEVTPDSCSTLAPRPWTEGELAMVSLMCSFVILVGVSTMYDIWRPSSTTTQSSAKRALLAFSLPANWSRLFNTDDVPPGALGSLDGIRVLSTFWVIITHKVLAFSQEPWSNKYMIVESLSSIFKMPLVNSMLNVDTFFLVSGLLKAYHFLRDLELGRFNFFSCYSRRYLRLTPAYALVIAFYATLLSRLSSGPSWVKTVEQPAAACREHWLGNLLYVNNYLNNDNRCMLQSWYLAADMQLCLISPLIVYPLWRWPRLGHVLLSVVTVASVAIPTAITFVTGSLPTYSIAMPDKEILYYMANVYYATHTRMAPYIVGIGLGYLLYKLNATKVKLTKLTVTCGWALSLSTMYAVVFGAYDLMQYDYQYNRVEAALYGGLHRFTWAVAVGWLIFACHVGYGGLLNRFLCARVFQPLSRLSYCIYLTHYAVLLVGTGRIRNAIFVDEFVLLHGYAGDLFFTLLASTVLYLFVEAPMFELTKILYGRGKSPAKNSILPATNKQPCSELKEITKVDTQSKEPAQGLS